MKSGKQFINTLEDNIRRRGAMDKLLSDSAKTEISKKVMDILRAYHISNWHSEPYHQNQNPAEWRYRSIKSWTNTVMNRFGETCKLLVVIDDICMLHFKSYCMWCIVCRNIKLFSFFRQPKNKKAKIPSFKLSSPSLNFTSSRVKIQDQE